jgi:serine phosphatase RsbU (regulator of sigma subunit)
VILTRVMAIESEHLSEATTSAVSASSLEAFAAAGRELAEGTSMARALGAIVRAAAVATGAEVVVARVVDPDGWRASARCVESVSRALAAELEGSRVEVAELAAEEVDQDDELPAALSRLVERTGARAALSVPVHLRGRLVGSLELVRPAGSFDESERLAVRLAAQQIGAAVRTFEPGGGVDGANGARRVLELAGEALAAGADRVRTPEEIVRLAAESAGAEAAALWRRDDPEGSPVPVASFPDGNELVGAGARLAAEAFEAVPTVVVGRLGGGSAVTIRLGRPASFALQLAFAQGEVPAEDELARLAIFGVRAAHALRATERARTLETELDRTRALLAAVAQANEELSLEHTLATVAERVAELLETDRIAVYLREEGRLVPASSALPGNHARVAERLLELALGPFRGRGMVAVEDVSADARLAGLEGVLRQAGIEAAIAVPLLVPDDVVGLLAAYPPRGRTLTENESTLLAALAAQLAVVVQNARLHERATELTAERERDLAELQRKEENLRALYEISRSFAQSLSLEMTLDAVARTVVDLLGVDAAVIRMPDERGDQLVPRVVHVADPRLEAALRPVLEHAQPLENLLGRRLLRGGRALVLDAAIATRLPAYALLVPFLEKGSTAVVLPLATPSELLGTLSVLSLDPARPLTPATTELALSVAAQAALALDNARLYQQQKEFSDTMQRSLLPRSRPRLPGIEVGDVYESSARVDVGGDVYDYLTLADGRLAVVLGDVTGHGIAAAADMAMAKFVFRCLAREHPDPADFLAAANDVVCGEIASGKFITMLYLTIDPERGEIACASAGHPPPRIVEPSSRVVRSLGSSGLVLGIEADQRYEETRERLEPGAAVVVYTDGLLEARRGGELYGDDRLDRLLAERGDLPAAQLARELVDDCKRFSDGELADDCAVVVIKRTGP